MRKETLAQLSRIIASGAASGERSLQMLRDPESEGAFGWFIFMPPHFNDALDIRKMTRYEKKIPYEVWTQGSNFGFKQGDILYDTAEGYSEWTIAITRIRLAVQVRAASDVAPARSNSPRFPGSVEFEILKPDSAKIHLVATSKHTMSQDDFVRYLISGELE